jgi:hypothetical protein
MLKVPAERRSQTEAPALFVEARNVEDRRHLDSVEARASGAASVKAFGTGSPTWESVAPLIRAGWSGRHDVACDPRHDWRLCWPAVTGGWANVWRALDPPRLDAGQGIAGARGMVSPKLD